MRIKKLGKVQKKLKELIVVAKDRLGLLAEVSEALGKAKVNIESISVETTMTKKAIIRVITRSVSKARKALKKAGFKPMQSNVLVVRLRDQPGELAKISRVLAEAKISIKNFFLLERAKGETITAVQTSNNKKAKTLLKNYLLLEGSNASTR